MLKLIYHLCYFTINQNCSNVARFVVFQHAVHVPRIFGAVAENHSRTLNGKNGNIINFFKCLTVKFSFPPYCALVKRILASMQSRVNFGPKTSRQKSTWKLEKKENFFIYKSISRNYYFTGRVLSKRLQPMLVDWKTPSSLHVCQIQHRSEAENKMSELFCTKRRPLLFHTNTAKKHLLSYGVICCNMSTQAS